jgi:soluble lytic murein transglycosylase-like protein
MMRVPVIALSLLVISAYPNFVGAQPINETPRSISGTDGNHPRNHSQWSAYITEASQRFDVPIAWIEGVMVAESGGKTSLNGRPITSRAGAMGLMQLMPATYAEMRAQYGLGDNPHDPHDNILAGTAYLRLQYLTFGYPGLFAAYNAGPARYAASLRGVRLPLETRKYLRQLTQADPKILSGTDLFITRSSADEGTVSKPDTGLFVSLSEPNPNEN